MNEISGRYNVLFNGRQEYVQVRINAVIRDSRGDILYFEGPDETIYNWHNIAIIRRAK